MSEEETCLIASEKLTIEEVRNQGYVASEQAYSINQNPYPMGKMEHAWWEAGHSEATDDLCGRGPV